MTKWSIFSIHPRTNNGYFFLLTIKYCIFKKVSLRKISRIALKVILATLKIRARLGRDLPASGNDKVISPSREDFIFTKLRNSEASRKSKPREIFRIYSTLRCNMTRQFQHNNRATCLFFFHHSTGWYGVREIEFSQMGKNTRNSDLVCKDSKIEPRHEIPNNLTF